MSPGFRNLIAVVLTVALAGSGSERLESRNLSNASQATSRLQEPGKEILTSDILSADDSLSHAGYVLERQHRKVASDAPAQIKSSSRQIDVSYVILKRNGKVLMKFDENIYFGRGNRAAFGLFSFLGGPGSQVLVTQDIFRGGTQWVINLSPQPHVIFDGPKWAVGREADDMRVVDLDNDGLFELAVQITDFYTFQDLLPISRIPLPEIIFKYDATTQEYLPANKVFYQAIISEITVHEIVRLQDQFEQCGNAISRLLTLVYAGRESEAWDNFNSSYNFSDKSEIRSRVKEILDHQPVYKFIYNSQRAK
jgi:hypothetical protein